MTSGLTAMHTAGPDMESAIDGKHEDDLKKKFSAPETTKVDALWGQKPELYLRAVASYCEWNTDVDLSSPLPHADPYVPDNFINYYYNILQYILYEIGYPETVDETGEGASEKNRCRKEETGVAIVILSNPIEVVSLLIEAGRQCPGDVLLVLSMTWVEKRQSAVADAAAPHHLYVSKAITFMDNGRSALRVYNPPRRATYCINFLCPECTTLPYPDADGLEDGLECIMFSKKLMTLIDDKLWTRIKMAEVGVRVPETLAFTFRCRLTYDCSLASVVTVVPLTSKDGVDQLMRSAVERFVDLPAMRQHQKVVVKPSGVMWCSCMGVAFHDRSDVQSIIESCRHVLNDLQEGDAILVEVFCRTMKPRHCSRNHHPRWTQQQQLSTRGLSWAADDTNGCRFRATVCRGLEDKPHMSKMVVGVGCIGEPLNGDNTIGQSLDTSLIAFGVVDPAVRMRIYDNFRQSAENVFKAIIDHEETMSADERGSEYAQTDLLGIDFILADSTLDDMEPVAIEVNSMMCTVNCDLYEFMYADTRGETFEPLIEYIISASQKHQLHARTIIICGGDCRVVSDAAQKYKMHVVHLQPAVTSSVVVGTSHYSPFIYNNLPTDDDDQQLDSLISTFHSRFPSIVRVDGCLGLDTQLVPLASRLGRRLGLSGSSMTSPDAALLAADPAAVQTLLATRNAAIPQWPPSCMYSLRFDHSSTLKCPQAVYDIVTDRAPSWSDTRLLDDLLLFIKQIYRVDVVVYRHKLIGGFVSDYRSCHTQHSDHTADAMVCDGDGSDSATGGPNTNDCWCTCKEADRSLHWPTVLPADKRDQLLIAAYQCCNELGVISGVFSVDMTFNAVTPKLIRFIPCLDISTRRRPTGVDMLVYSLLIACDLKPLLPVNVSFQNHLRARRKNFGHELHDVEHLVKAACV